MVCDDLRSLPQVQRDAISHILCSVKRCGPPPADASHTGAFEALRVPRGTYQDVAVGVGDAVRMELGILSLPLHRDGGVSLEDKLGGEAGAALKAFEQEMLQDARNWGAVSGEVAKMKPCNDPQLAGKCFYHAFLRRLFGCGILGFCQRPRGRVGAFAVSKKPKVIDGEAVKRQRLILDCRQVNMQFRAPPITELGSLTALCDTELAKGESLFVGGADSQDCFYACTLPVALREFFCFGWDLDVSEVLNVTGGEMPKDCGEAEHGEIFRPCLTVLPMGFSWSFDLVQQLHEQATIQSLGIPREHWFLDARPVPRLQGKQVGAMPYCDNVHVLGKDCAAVEEGRNSVCSDLQSMGFSIHEQQPATLRMQTLGGIVDGDLWVDSYAFYSSLGPHSCF